MGDVFSHLIVSCLESDCIMTEIQEDLQRVERAVDGKQQAGSKSHADQMYALRY